MRTPARASDADLNEGNLFAYIRTFSAHAGCELIEDDRVLYFASGIRTPSMLSNGVYKCRFGGDDGKVREAVARVDDYYKRKKLPYFFTTGPSSSPGAGAAARGLGLLHGQSQAAMSLDLRSFPEDVPAVPNLEIRQVRDGDTLLRWLKVFAVGFKQSWLLAGRFTERYEKTFLDESVPARHFIGYIGRKPVATSTVFYGDGVAGLYNIVTVPEARRRGVATALTRTALAAGKRAGCAKAILQASSAGRAVYEKLGFATGGGYELYVGLHGASSVMFPLSYLTRIVTNGLRGVLPV